LLYNLVGVNTKQQIKFSPKLQNETIVIGDCPLAMKRNITKQLLRGNVRDSDSMRAGTARGGNSETRAFAAISISSVRKRGLFRVTAQTLFRQGSNFVVS